MKLFFQQLSLNVIVFMGLALVTILSVFSHFQVQQLNTANFWFDHTQQTINTTNSIIKNFYIIKDSVNQYLLTGNDNKLENYKSSVQLVNLQILELTKLTNDNTIQQHRLEELKKLISERIAFLNSIITMRKTHGLAYTINYIQHTLGKQNPYILTAPFIANLLQEINDEENQLLMKRRETLFNQLTFTTKIEIVVDVISVAIILLCFLALNRQLYKRFLIEKQLKSSQIKLEKLAYFDALTALPNRTGLLKKLAEIVATKKHHSDVIAFLYIDLDSFKNINDNFGHDIGDKYLIEVAKRLGSISYLYKFIARVSGDEFAILITEVNAQNQIKAIAEDVLNLITIPIKIDKQQIICTASIGIAGSLRDIHDENELIKNAKIALYKAKQLGKNNYQICNNEMRDTFEKRASLQLQLYKAVLENEFTLSYQPKMSLITGKPSGAEALIRWMRPEFGLTYPGEFIQYAEENGLIIPIGEWTLRTACEHINIWQKAKLNIPIAINVSAREFIVGNFTNTLTTVLDEMHLDPTQLEIEITESILLENSQKNISALQQLKSLGIQITIDDFGTGYSSLSYLNLLPIDKVKIDKSFIMQIVPGNHKLDLIGAIISLAHRLGMKVIAEGVETKLQADFLKNNHCDEIQGFLYSKPLSLEDLEDFYNSKAVLAAKNIL